MTGQSKRGGYSGGLEASKVPPPKRLGWRSECSMELEERQEPVLVGDDFNRAVFTLEFAPDKWSGAEEFREDVRLLLEIANRLNQRSSRRMMQVEFFEVWYEG